MRVAVIGGGWAGLAAAVHALRGGHAVSLYEMAGELGGRARRVDSDGHALDNGQHILIGAYSETLALMRCVGVDIDEVLLRLPLTLRYPDGSGLALRHGAAGPAFVRAVLGAHAWPWGQRLSLLAAAAGWAARGFRCPPQWTVARLTRALPPALQRDLVEPLCVAALNTPAAQASAVVFLRVLGDALFSGPGASDLLLPRRPLDALLPGPAAQWLERHGATLQRGLRVQAVEAEDGRWRVDGTLHDAVVLACSADEAARLARPVAPAWSDRAAAFDYEPIVTVYAHSEGTRLPQPMTALRAAADAPAQFVFDHGAMGGAAGLFALVVSGARGWLERGLDATAQAALQQAQDAFVPGTWRSPPRLLRAIAQKRATFLCVPGLDRPPTTIAPRLLAAGDYVQGPYPATLEGAVRAGAAAAVALG